ncbi:MAG: hypothetical protein CM15mP120_02050 [Pseudomonadota bacterium]|nr:MAG: hypothetical protein CM15mP120_02050 [Pseudomonadota bacterium]
MPVLAVMYERWRLQWILVLGQTAQGNVTLQQDFNLPFSLLDDSDLKVSFATDVETVPTLLVTDASGAVVSEQVGFVRDDWQGWLTNCSTRYRAAICPGLVDAARMATRLWVPLC